MKKLYARIVLWLIRPALDVRDADTARTSLDRLRITLRDAPPLDVTNLVSWKAQCSSEHDETASKPLGGCAGQASAEGLPG